MKKYLSQLLIKLYKIIIWKEPCVIYSRYYEYRKNKNDFSWYINKESCPFCNYNKNFLIKEYNYFILLKNKFPYLETKEHVLLVPKRHIAYFYEFNKEEKEEYLEIIDELLKKGYFLLQRYYKYNKTSTVYHFHTHFILNKE